MSLRQPREKTIKRLFAVSNNRCTFENCTRSLVDPSGIVTGVICHIKARKPNWARYDATQSDEERHGFDNLILMCGEHHKIIDEQPVTEFAVERLIELKAAHENGMAIAEPSDEIAQAFLRNSGFIGDVTQTSADDAINVAAGGNVVIYKAGLTYSEAKELALDVYRSNALELSGIAERIARDRVDEFTADFLERLRVSHPQPPETLGDPDMQYALFDAQRHAARSATKGLDEILLDLLVQRATSKQEDLLQIVLNEAITDPR